MSESGVALELRRINKWFGPVHANKDVSLSVGRGTIHGIIGENGAGKSALMSIVYGYYRADSGEILVDGKVRDIQVTQDSIAAGIGMVHQHFMLVDNFTVLENVILGVEGGAILSRSKARVRGELEKLAQDYALDVDVDAVVGDLPVGIRQRVEILKALYRGAEILILDEPTGVLTPQEATHLFTILGALRDQGKTVILITHKLREIMAITSAVTVMRQGRVVAGVMTKDTSPQQLAEMMVGHEVLLRVDKKPAQLGEVVLAVENLSLTDAGAVERLRDINFHVRAGEIVGIAGVSGNGQSELLETLSGIRRLQSGRILFKGQDISASLHEHAARNMRNLGLAHVPEDRQRSGLVLNFEANECTILGYHGDPTYGPGPFLDHRKTVDTCKRQIEEFDVRPTDPHLRASDFSGGNQQKLVLAREMDRDPVLLLVGQPTRGVDIGAIEFIHRRLIDMRDRGKAILLVSAELDEIMSLSDRIIVMFDGRIVGEIDQASATETQIGLMMTGHGAPA